MSSIKTQIGAHDQATEVPFAPIADIPATDTWTAIKYVHDKLSGLIGTINAGAGTVQTLGIRLRGVLGIASAGRELALQALGAVQTLGVKVRKVQATADTARELDLVTRGQVQTLGVKVRQADRIARGADQAADVATGLANNALTKIRKIDDVQIALKAQVFN